MRIKARRTLLIVGLSVPLLVVGVTAGLPATELPARDAEGFVASFSPDPSDLATTGRNRYWILEPGYRVVLEGNDTKVAIMVLDETVRVGTVETRVVEEREWQNGELVEVSRNFYAMSRSTGDLYYFGEDVDIFKDGKVVGHEGSWRAFDGQNRPGLMMPGTPRPGMRYYQELAPGVAMDRAEILALGSTLDTPNGVTLKGCLEVEETSALNARERSTKIYAPGIGVVVDDEVSIVSHGFAAPSQLTPRNEATSRSEKGDKE